MLTPEEQRVLLQKLLEKQELAPLDLVSLFDEAYTQSNDVLLATILIGLKSNGESLRDIVSTLQWLQGKMIQIPNMPANAIDLCGTGGDTVNTFNISTAAAFVVAEAGISVVKNGGRSNRGFAGSSDVLTALQVPLCKTPNNCATAIKNCNLAFLDAPSFHPALVTFRFVRKKLGFPTILNTVAALANPARVTNQVIGVSSPDLVKTVADILFRQSSHIEHALVVHGNGIDEVTISGKTIVAEVTRHGIIHYTIDPEMLGVRRASLESIRGGNAQFNSSIIQDVLSGKMKGPSADVVALNAGAAIYVGSAAPTISDGVRIAEAILSSGAGLKKLEQMQSLSL